MPRNTCPSLRSDTPIIRHSGRRAQIADTAAFTASTAETDWLDRLWSFRHDDEALAAFPGSTDRARDLIAHARSVGALDDSTECWWLTPQQRLAAAPELASLAHWHDHPPTALASRMGTVVNVKGNPAIASVVASVAGASGFRLAPSDQEADSSSITIACAVTLPESSESVLTWMSQAAQSRPHLPDLPRGTGFHCPRRTHAPAPGLRLLVGHRSVGPAWRLHYWRGARGSHDRLTSGTIVRCRKSRRMR